MSDAGCGVWSVVVPAPDGYAQGRVIHWGSWSGRWESNPPLTLYKLLNILASLPLFASNCVQLQGI